ncbi:MAG: hypothetical protein M1819_007263 [Sarea resinae]|nr:MAG: hypothetical protein M1819_007263 [Sarea resinae]
MRSYEDIVLSHVRKFCAQLYRVNGEKRIANPGWSVAIDMAKWCDFLTFDIMSDVVFGVAYNTLENNRYRFVPEAIEASNVRVGVIAQAPEMKLWRLDKRLFPQAIKARNRFISFVDEMLRDGIKATSTKKGRIMSLLMDAKDPETDTIIRKSELGAETATLIVAGTDTTSTAIASMFFYLTHNPKAYTRLAQEIRSTFGSNEDIHLGQRLNSCTYLRACIDESMRMSPSVGGALWREADAGGAIVDGQVIAAGCDVGTGIYSIHHNPEYYPCPFDFVPERWLSEEASSIHGEVDLAHAALNPFSFGPRGCIGKGLAYMEMVLTWAHVLWSFEFKAADGPEGQIGEGQPGAEHGRHRTGEYQLEDRLTSAKHGPYIQFYPRAVQ